MTEDQDYTNRPEESGPEEEGQSPEVSQPEVAGFDPHDREEIGLPEAQPTVADVEGSVNMDEPNSDDRMWAALSHITQIFVPVVVPVIVLLSEANNRRPFQRYHAVHALTLLAISVLYEIVAVIAYSILSAISAGCFACILWPIFLLPVVVFVYYAYEAYEGAYAEVPYVTEFLRDQGWL